MILYFITPILFIYDKCYCKIKIFCFEKRKILLRGRRKQRLFIHSAEVREAESTVEAPEWRAETLLLLLFGTIFVAFRLLPKSLGIRSWISFILFDCFSTPKLWSEEAGNTLLPSERLILSTEVTQHSCHFSSARSATTSSSVIAANADTLSRRVERGISTRSSDFTASTSTFCARNPDRVL